MSKAPHARPRPDGAVAALQSIHALVVPVFASPFRWFGPLLLTRGAPLYAVPGASAAACALAWKDAQVGGKARGDLVAAVAAKDVIGLSKAEARAAKEEVVLEILGDDRLSEKALSGLFMEAGGANGGPCLFPPFFFRISASA